MELSAAVEAGGDVLLDDGDVELAVLTGEFETTKAIVDDPEGVTGELLLAAAGFDDDANCEELCSDSGVEVAIIVELDPSFRDEIDVDGSETGVDGIAEDGEDVVPMLRFVIVNSGEALPLSPNKIRI